MRPLATQSRKQLDAFIHRIMEPLPDEAVIDTQYNSILRQSRRDAWLKADGETTYWRALVDLAHGAEAFQRRGGTVPYLPPLRRELLVPMYREAEARQIITPAYLSADVAWKRRKPHDDEGDDEPFLGWPEKEGQGRDNWAKNKKWVRGVDAGEPGFKPLHFDGDGYHDGQKLLRDLQKRRPDKPQQHVRISPAIGRKQP
jgi:hypothetical protein